jgi:hypothetical protein
MNPASPADHLPVPDNRTDRHAELHAADAGDVGPAFDDLHVAEVIEPAVVQLPINPLAGHVVSFSVHVIDPQTSGGKIIPSFLCVGSPGEEPHSRPSLGEFLPVPYQVAGHPFHSGCFGVFGEFAATLHEKPQLPLCGPKVPKGG